MYTFLSYCYLKHLCTILSKNTYKHYTSRLKYYIALGWLEDIHCGKSMTVSLP